MSIKKETYSWYPLSRKSETELEIEYEKIVGISLGKYCKRYPLSTTLILVLPLLVALAISFLLYWLGVYDIMPLWLWIIMCFVIGSIMSQIGWNILLSRWHKNKNNIRI